MGALALGHGPAPRVPQDMGKSRCHWPERCEGQGSMALLSHWDLRAGSSGRSLPWESWLSWLARWWDSLGTVRWQAGAASSPAWAGLPWAKHPKPYLVVTAHPTPALLAFLGSVHPLSQNSINCWLLLPFRLLLTHPLPTAQLGMEHSPRSGGTARAGVQRGLECGTTQGCGAQREIGGGVK